LNPESDRPLRVAGSASAVLAGLLVLAAGADPGRAMLAAGGYLVAAVWPWTSFGRRFPAYGAALAVGSLLAGPALSSALASALLAVLAIGTLLAFFASSRDAFLAGTGAVALLLAVAVVAPHALAGVSLDPVLPGHALLLAIAGAALLAIGLLIRPEVSP